MTTGVSGVERLGRVPVCHLITGVFEQAGWTLRAELSYEDPWAYQPRVVIACSIDLCVTLDTRGKQVPSLSLRVALLGHREPDTHNRFYAEMQ